MNNLNLKCDSLSQPEAVVDTIVSNIYNIKQATEKWLPTHQVYGKPKDIRCAWINKESFRDAEVEYNSLPPELIKECFQYLNLSDLVSCSEVSIEWKACADDKFLWSQLYSSMFRPCKKAIHGLNRLSSCELRRAIQQRLQVNLGVSTRAKHWLRPNGSVVAHNDSILRSFLRGAIESIRTEDELYPFLISTAFGGEICYFEATIIGGASIGISSISSEEETSNFGYGSQNHVGWMETSYGYHGDDGHVFWNDGNAPYGGMSNDYGPAWYGRQHLTTMTPNPMVIGCGYNRKENSVFFTLNGEMLGTAFNGVLRKKYAASLSLHRLGDRAEINLGRSPFIFDLETYFQNHLCPPLSIK